MTVKKLFLLLLAFAWGLWSFAQQQIAVHGDFQINSQTYAPDSIIDAQAPPEKLLANIYGNIVFRYRNFSAGLRYEAYQNALLGYDRRYNGQGIAHRYIDYTDTFISITLGNFYEQFGNGLVLRTFEDRSLGYDNAFDGMRLRLHPVSGLYIKTLIGRQRYFWEKSSGIVRAADAEINVNDLLHKQWKTDISIGGSFVSKYQPDDNPVYKLPQNVAAFATRVNINRGYFALNAEHAYKINDPSADNGYIYKPGNATYLTMSYARTGFGFIISADRYDNFSFRSDRNATLNSLYINSLPTIVPTHSYGLETIYPYVVQPLNEMGISAQLFIRFKRKSFLGGKYGTFVSLDMIRINNIDKSPVFDGTGYVSRFFVPGKDIFYQEIAAKVEKKFSRSFKLKAKYMNLVYNKDFVQGMVGYGTVYANIAVLDMLYKFSLRKALRTELQVLQSHQDLGNWVMAFAEYSFSPHWYFSVFDQYNFGNTHLDRPVNYYTIAITYVRQASRISIGYGRQREGIVCVGGVCRNVPASNGFTFSISTSF